MANIYPTTVKSKTLVAGDKNAGFFGEVPVSELWSGQELSSLLGITEGTLQHSNEPWLKFIIDEKIIYKSKKSIRYSISWNHLNEKGVVYGDKIIEDKYGNQYKVRLMKGALTDPAKDNDPDQGAKGSEWNRLMLPIHEKAKNKNWKYPQFVEPEIPTDWNINYTDADLLTNSSAGNGSVQWCQETIATNSSSRMYRGGNGVSYSSWAGTLDTGYSRGWSPVLELIEKNIFIKNNNTIHTKEGEKPFTKENLIEENAYELKELDRKITTFNQPLESESFYKKSTINLKKYFDIHSIGVGGRLVEKKIDFNMTSNTTPAPYVASASSEYSDNYQAWKAFDNSETEYYWCTVSGSVYNTLNLKLINSNTLMVNKIIIKPVVSYAPQKISIHLKLNGEEVFNEVIEVQAGLGVIEINKIYKKCDEIHLDFEKRESSNYVGISEIEVYELVKE